MPVHSTFRRLAIALTLCVMASPMMAWSQAQTAAAADPVPRKIALISAIGDRISLVRATAKVGSNMEPYVRKDIQVNTQGLNKLVVAGLDAGYEVTDPESERIVLEWTPPPEEASLLAESRYLQREERMEELLVRHLTRLPQRQGWDEIVAVLPKWYFTPVKGMATKLSGVGFYIHAMGRSDPEDLTDASEMRRLDTHANDDETTIDPKTGAKGASDVYVAVFMYMQKITFDAKTMTVKSREIRRDNIKFYDPNSAAIDVANMLDHKALAKGLGEVIERTAKKSVTGNVFVSDLKEVPPAPAPASSPAK